MKPINQIVGLFLCAVVLASCYAYGPTHKPYTLPSRRSVSYKQEYLNRAMADVKKDIPEAVVSLVQDSIIILFPEHIIYQRQEVEPADKYKVPLENLSRLLQTYKETDLLVTGHCDNTGSYAFNKKLSLKRADFIRAYLIATGMEAFRIDSWGLGSSNPIADNSTEQGRQRNRRVEFVVLYADGSRR